MKKKFYLELFSGIAVFLLFAVALFMRTKLPYGQVFSGDWIKFAGVDAYRHMRIVDSIVRNFPHILPYDPYLIYGGTDITSNIILFDWLLAGIIWVVGLGSPTQHLVDVVGAYFPAVLGALIVIPVYFLGKELFGRLAGLLAAAILVLIPGEFLGRSVLSFTDHHVAEVLFSTTVMLFLVLATKTARTRQLTLAHIKDREAIKPLVYSFLAGFIMMIYLFTWGGAPFLIFIIILYFIIQFIIDHLKQQSTDHLFIVGSAMFLVTLLLSWELWSLQMVRFSLFGALLIVIALKVLSRVIESRKLNPGYYPLALVVAGLVFLAIFRVAFPYPFQLILQQFDIFFPSAVAQTTLEMQPILLPEGRFSFGVVWGNFTTTIFAALIALSVLIYLLFRSGIPERTLLIVWTVVMLAATLGQRRFAYYLAIDVAVLTSYMCWLLLVAAKLQKPAVDMAPVPVKAESMSPKRRPVKEGRAPTVTRAAERRRARRHQSGYFSLRLINIALAAIIIFFFAFFFNIKPAIAVAKQAIFAPSDAWCQSLDWLRDNTPEPFGDANYYYRLYPQLPDGQMYQYPQSAYSIMSWWDYGYWITRISHRVPATNPSQDPGPIIDVANFMLSQDEAGGQKLAQKLNSSYIIIDYSMVTSKLWAMARWSGGKQEEYFDMFYVVQNNQLTPLVLFYPPYYRSLGVRLYNFEGKAVTPENTVVINFEDKVARDGTPYKEITGAQTFATFDDAQDYVAKQNLPKYRIVSNDPFVSSVPLAALEQFKLVHGDGSIKVGSAKDGTAEVKIFEYTGARTK